jgi:hypothetical protein
MRVVTDQELLGRHLSPEMAEYFARKFAGLDADELHRRVAECLKGLTLMHLLPGDIPFSEEIDAVWHYWLLETAEYAELCLRITGGEFLHHSSADYPPMRQAQAEQSPRDAVRRLLAFFALYVSRFGAMDERRLAYWPALAALMEVYGWNPARANEVFQAHAYDLERALRGSPV